MKFRFAAATAVVALALATPLQANDSTAETRAGGLVLVQNRDIDMREEDLFVSADQIRVRYVFRNTAAQDRTVTVAFPLPDRDLADEQHGNVGYPSDFRTTVDGRPMELQVQRRAFVRGTDHTALLNRLRVPISPEVVNDRNTAVAALDALPRAEQDRLVRLGVAAVEEYDAGQGMERHLAPAWTIRESWTRQQTFPAGRDVVVEHRYTPGAGGSVGTVLSIPNMRSDPDYARTVRDYCVDQAFLSGVQRLAREGGEASGGIVPERRVGYILTTGGNWRSPIGRFRLVVDKGDARNLVSFCGEGVRRISPTQFEMVRTNWRPDRDLRVLIVGPADALFRE